MLRTDKLSRINRRLTALLAAGLVLSSPMRFPGIAKAEGVAPDSQVTVRPVDEVSEETVLREAAELAEGTPVTEQPGESDEDSGTVRPTACSERGDHYPVSNKKDLFIPVGIDFK